MTAHLGETGTGEGVYGGYHRKLEGQLGTDDLAPKRSGAEREKLGRRALGRTMPLSRTSVRLGIGSAVLLAVSAAVILWETSRDSGPPATPKA